MTSSKKMNSNSQWTNRSAIAALYRTACSTKGKVDTNMSTTIYLKIMDDLRAIETIRHTRIIISDIKRRLNENQSFFRDPD